MSESVGLGILEIILGIIALVLGIGFIFNPALFAFLSRINYIHSRYILCYSRYNRCNPKAGNSRWNGVVAIIIGLLYIIVGSIVSNPVYLRNINWSMAVNHGNNDVIPK